MPTAVTLIRSSALAARAEYAYAAPDGAPTPASRRGRATPSATPWHKGMTWMPTHPGLCMNSIRMPSASSTNDA